MGVSDVIFDSIRDFLNEVKDYYEDNYNKMATDEDIIDIVACHLKVSNRRDYLKADRHRVKNINWVNKAKKFIEDFVYELLEEEN